MSRFAHVSPLSRIFGRLAVGCVLAGCLITSAHCATKRLRLAYILPMESQLGAGAQVFAAEVKARTDGRFEIESYPNAMLGGEVAVLEALQADAIDIAFVTGAPLPNVVPEAGIFNIPFLFRDATEARRLLDGPIGEDYLRKFDAHGLHALAWGENGMRQLTNSRRPVRTPADLSGLSLRLPQSDIMTAGFSALGATIKAIPFTQVYPALRTGVVDGQENPIATIVSSRFYEVQSHLTLTGHVYDPALLLMPEDSWNELSPAERDAFTQAAKAGAAASREFASRAEKSGLATIKAAGVAVVESIDRGEFVRKAAAASPFYERRFGPEAIARIRSFTAATPGGGERGVEVPR